MMKNYLKTKSGRIFTFVDTVPESLESAWLAAVFDGTPICIYRPARFEGPWDTCPVIGHRTRGEVLADLSMESDEDELDRLHDELSSLDYEYQRVGRRVPLTAVAA